MTSELYECELCGEEIEPEQAIYFYNDVQVNPDYIEPTHILCKSCATENGF